MLPRMGGLRAYLCTVTLSGSGRAALLILLLRMQAAMCYTVVGCYLPWASCNTAKHSGAAAALI